VTYSDHHNRNGKGVGAVEDDEREEDTTGEEAAASVDQDDLADELDETSDALAVRLFTWDSDAPAPEWLPEQLLREWVSRPSVVTVLRRGLDQGTRMERQQLILTGIGRKGAVTPDSPAAGALARLCYRSATWWGRVSATAMREYARADGDLSVVDLTGLPDNLDDLLDEYDPEVLVLTCLRLGFEGDEVQVVATEAAEALGTTAVAAAMDEELNTLRARLELAESERRTAEKELKEEKQARRAAEQRVETHARELERLRTLTTQAGDATAQLAEVQRELTQTQGELAARAAALDAAHEDADRIAELEGQLTAAEEEAAVRRDAIAASLAQVARGRQAEQELQQALRTIGELNVRIAELEQHAGALPILDDARSLVQLLDGAIGSLVADAAERIRGGEAREDDRQLLAFAAEFVDFKSGIAAAAPPSAPESTPEAEAEPTAAEPHTPAPEPDVATEEDGRRAAVNRRVRTRLGWTVKPLGGAGEIGASAILATTPSGHSILLDAGQRVRGVYGSSSNDYDFHYGVAGVDELAAILVSHAHIDHTGSLPVLHRNQSAQQQQPIPVYMSEPTIELAQIMMADSAKIQHARERERRDLGESDFAEEMATTRPAYDLEEVRRVAEACVSAVPYRQFEIPRSGIVARFEPVPHVLGACAIHLTDIDSGATLLYTGDLGPIADPQLTLPDFNGVEHITPADLVVIESTYGKQTEVATPDGRTTGVSRRARDRARFYKIAGDAIGRGGCVLLPCFSLGRAQEIARLIQQAPDRELAATRIYIGGMAERILEVYVNYAERGERDRGIRWVSSGQFPRTSSLHTRLSLDFGYGDVASELLASGEPCFIIASPAMLNGGWSLTFANEMIDDPRHAVLFTGFLPRDDRTQLRLSDWRRDSMYTLDGSRRPIRSDWEKVGLSAHASADDLRLFAREIAAKADGEVSFLCVHGEPGSERALAEDIRNLPNVTDVRALVNNDQYTGRR
jgi:Cft2 family RNA processing exonuclease